MVDQLRKIGASRGIFPPPNIPGKMKYGFHYDEISPELGEYIENLDIQSRDDEIKFYKYLSKLKNDDDREYLTCDVNFLEPVMNDGIFEIIDGYYKLNETDQLEAELSYFDLHGLNFSILLEFFKINYEKWCQKHKETRYYIKDYNFVDDEKRCLNVYIPGFDGVQMYEDGETEIIPGEEMDIEDEEIDPIGDIHFNDDWGNDEEDPQMGEEVQNQLDDNAGCSADALIVDAFPTSQSTSDVKASISYQKVLAGYAVQTRGYAAVFDYNKTFVSRYQRAFSEFSIEYKTITAILASEVTLDSNITEVLDSDIKDYWGNAQVKDVVNDLRMSIKDITKKRSKDKRLRDRNDLRKFRRERNILDRRKVFVHGEEYDE